MSPTLSLGLNTCSIANTRFSDISHTLSALSLQQPPAMPQHVQSESHAPSYNARAAEAPLTAPTPSRGAYVPTPGVWSPETGIAFGKVTTPNSKPTVQVKDARWDPSKGVRFG